MQLLQQARSHEIFTDINFYFNFVDVRDVAEGMIVAAEKGRRGERYLLATENAVNVRRILELAREQDPSIKLPPRLPKFLLLGMASAMELASKITGKAPLLLRSQVHIFYDNDRRMDISKARTELGFTPRDPEIAIREAFVFDYLANRSKKCATKKLF